ncbi:MAG: prepilin-type N-terminal cleavage/methylation domain-containing protein [Rubripirellula sp.]
MSKKMNAKTTRQLRDAFTLTEMMIAMAITLILMAALGKTFALMGESIREGRVKVDLTSQLRDITLRLNSDLERCTVPITPVVDEDRGDGYFVYYEGPLTDVTGLLMGNSPSSTNENSYQDSKFGDLDDYLAFTSVAEAGNWYRGKVPRFVLDMKSVDLLGANQNAGSGDDIVYDPADFPGNPFDPIVISSKYAEIAYFASPEYILGPDADDSSKQIFTYNTDPFGNPQYIDDDTNGLPDRIRMHRRVLLIRPDLALTSPTNAVGPQGTLGTYTHTFGSETITYMSPDNWAVDNGSSIPAIKTPTVHGISRPQTNLAWLIGMAPIHQQCDLSVRRRIGGIDTNGLLNMTGEPTGFVAPNSLADLSKPENRFAHVRIPGTLIQAAHNATNPFTSMPVLAMGALPTILDPTANSAVPSSGNVITPTTLNGFLRPEFVLGMDHTHTEVFGDGWGMERLSEDVIATNVLGFDVKGFDSEAPSFISYGNDQGPGIASVDDDQNGTTDDTIEAGWLGSDDTVVGPNDAAMREVILRDIAFPAEVIPSHDGDFVDLFYPFLAGGTIRGPAAVQLNEHSSAASPLAIPIANFRLAFGFDSELSGLLTGAVVEPGPLYTDAMLKSGKVITGSTHAVLMVQPSYDTFSDHYERDGYLQTFPDNNGSGLRGTVWYTNNATTGTPPAGYNVDIAVNGLDDGGAFGADDELEKETNAPFTTPLTAVKVILRLENTTTRQIEQMSSVTQFDR